MKNKYIVVIVIVVIVGAFVFFNKNKKVEAPLAQEGDKNVVQGDINSESIISNTMPVPGENSNVKESIVEGVREFTVSGKNFSYDQNTITVKKGDRVKITFNNTGGFHNLVIDEYGVTTKTAQAPFSDTIEFTADKVGSFEYYCSVGSHRAQGMFGVLKVE